MPGFTRFDNQLLERVLTSDFTKRQLKIVLLVVRFSAGYQKRYAILRKADFAYARVSPTCISGELRNLARMRVLIADAEKDAVWLNPDLDAWAVERIGDAPRRFFRIATKNHPKWQLAQYRNRNVAVAGTGTTRRKKDTDTKERRADELFEGLLKDYYLHVGPLAADETAMLRQGLDAYGSAAVRLAIRELSWGRDRSFRHFLKTLDTTGTRGTSRRGGVQSLRSSIEQRRDHRPRS